MKRIPRLSCFNNSVDEPHFILVKKHTHHSIVLPFHIGFNIMKHWHYSMFKGFNNLSFDQRHQSKQTRNPLNKRAARMQHKAPSNKWKAGLPGFSENTPYHWHQSDPFCNISPTFPLRFPWNKRFPLLNYHLEATKLVRASRANFDQTKIQVAAFRCVKEMHVKLSRWVNFKKRPIIAAGFRNPDLPLPGSRSAGKKHPACIESRSSLFHRISVKTCMKEKDDF